MEVSDQIHVLAVLPPPPGKEHSPSPPFNGKLGVLQSWSVRGVEEKKNPSPCRESNPGPASSLVVVLTG
jgi:hypothetical protein